MSAVAAEIELGLIREAELVLRFEKWELRARAAERTSHPARASPPSVPPPPLCSLPPHEAASTTHVERSTPRSTMTAYCRGRAGVSWQEKHD
jgi:hypothetical protein